MQWIETYMCVSRFQVVRHWLLPAVMWRKEQSLIELVAQRAQESARSPQGARRFVRPHFRVVQHAGQPGLPVPGCVGVLLPAFARLCGCQYLKLARSLDCCLVRKFGTLMLHSTITAGDVSHNTAALIPPLLEDGIRFLIYAGELLSFARRDSSAVLTFVSFAQARPTLCATASESRVGASASC